MSFRNHNQLPAFTRWLSSVVAVRRKMAPLYEELQDSFMNAIIAQLMLFEEMKNFFAISFWKHLIVTSALANWLRFGNSDFFLRIHSAGVYRLFIVFQDFQLVYSCA